MQTAPISATKLSRLLPNVQLHKEILNTPLRYAIHRTPQTYHRMLHVPALQWSTVGNRTISNSWLTTTHTPESCSITAGHPVTSDGTTTHRPDDYEGEPRQTYWVPTALLVAAAVGFHQLHDKSMEAYRCDDSYTFVDAPKRMRHGLEELCRCLGESKISVNADELASLSTASWTDHEGIEPRLIAFPESTEDVSEIVKICNKYEIPIVPHGCTTSLEGQTVLCREGIVMSMIRMNGIKELRVQDADVTVGCGIQWNDLNEQIASSGLFYPIDPGPGASIGGMIATRCSGTNAVRYGVMKDWVLSLTVVLADGRIIKTGSRARKDSAGYDLVRLFCGSEGTLGIVTEATLKLAPKPAHQSVAIATFKSAQDICDCVHSIVKHGIQIGCAELLDENSVEAANSEVDKPLEVAPTLMLKFTGTKVQIEEAIAVTQKIAKDHAGRDFRFVATNEEADKLWNVRKAIYWTLLDRADPNMKSIITDVCVPVGSLANLVEATRKDFDDAKIFAAMFGHIGDGNFHLTIFYDGNSKEEYAKVKALYDKMVERSIACGGTCTGEHGVGIGKKHYLTQMFDEGTVSMMKAIKAVFDPKNIMNPGKVLDV